MPEGQIVRAVGGFYYVRTTEGDIECRARGVFKKKKLTPLVGDWCLYERTGDGKGVITQLHPRKTELLRPPIANVEQAIIACSLYEPPFHPLLVDRLLVHIERAGLEAVVCLTKLDLVSTEEEVEKIRSLYTPLGYPVLAVSVKTEVGLEELKEKLRGKLTVFAGQSGVGKSSLLNHLYPPFNLEVGEVSKRLRRGRHTTRHVEILDLPEGGQVADTPGFSQLTMEGIEVEELEQYFPEIFQRSIDCRFRGCLHQQEPGCAVRSAVEDGEISTSRYQHYLQFIEEINRQRRY